MKHKNIPEGYKDSLLGIIPKEWEVKTIGEVCDIYVGKDLNLNSYSKRRDNTHIYPVYSNTVDANGWYGGYYNFEEYKGNCVTVVGRGVGLGTAFYRDKGFGAIGRLLVLYSDKCDAKYLTEYINGKVEIFVESAAIPQLTGKQIANYRIAVPPINEQKKIAEILSVWDEAIDKQTKLINTLIRRKRRLTQLLFTIPKQMKKISKEQKKMRLGDVCNIYNNNTFSREQLNYENGNIQNIHYGDVLIKFSSILDVSRTNLPFINDSILQKYSPNNFVCEGDIIIADTAEDETVGKACEVIGVGNKKIISGLHTIWLRPQKDIFVPGFLGYYINSTAYHKQLLPLMQGIKVSSISKQAISNTLLATPSPEEQITIVKILTQADLEIELKQKYLDIIQSQKHGLLQQLLTGKKRIK